MFLLDTNVISELRKAKPHGAVRAWLLDRAEQEVFLSALTFGELQSGVEKTRKTDPRKAAEIERWIDKLAGSYRVLDMDGVIFREWARLTSGKPERLLEDGMIAATARVHRLTIATRNVRDFRSFDVPLINPFETG